MCFTFVVNPCDADAGCQSWSRLEWQDFDEEIPCPRCQITYDEAVELHIELMEEYMDEAIANEEERAMELAADYSVHHRDQDEDEGLKQTVSLRRTRSATVSTRTTSENGSGGRGRMRRTLFCHLISMKNVLKTIVDQIRNFGIGLFVVGF